MSVLRGINAIEAAMKESNNLRLKNGESKTVRVMNLDNAVSFYEHTIQSGGRWQYFACLGTECPACSADRYAGFKCAIPVVDLSDNTPKIFKMSRKTTKAFRDFIKEYPDFAERDIKINRQGGGSDTTYLFYARDKSSLDMGHFELPNMEEATTKYSKEEIIKILVPSEIQEEEKGDDDFPF